MKRMILLALCMLFVLPATYAQELTQNYDGQSITFQYPDTWQLTEDSANHLFLVYNNTLVDIFVSALTLDQLKLDELASTVLQTNGITDATPPTLASDGTLTLQTTTADGRILYLRGFTLEDGGVMFIRTNTDDETTLTVIDSIIPTIQPKTSGSRYYAAPNSLIAFNQPIGYFVNSPSDGVITLANQLGIAEPSADAPFPSGSFQLVIFTNLLKVPNYTFAPDDTTQEILFKALNVESCPDGTCIFSEYLPITSVPNVTGTELTVQSPTLDILALAVETAESSPIVYTAYSAPNETNQWLDVVQTVVQSAVPLPIEIPQVADTATVINGFSVAHPQGWTVQALGSVDAYTFATRADISNDPNQLQANEVFGFVVPNFEVLKGIINYPNPLTPDLLPSTLISYFGSVAYLTQGQPMGAMEQGQLLEREYAGVIILPNEGNFQQQIYVISRGDGDFITLIAYVRGGWLAQWQPIFRDILAKSGKTQ